MLISELNEYLYSITEQEKKHKLNPYALSSRYQRIEKVKINNENIFLFQFDSLLKDSNIFMNKESRFAAIPKHIHSIIEINYVYSGTCTQIIDKKEIQLNQGDLCILDTNTPHEISPLSENDIVITIGMRKNYIFNGFLSRMYDGGILVQFLASVLSENYQSKQFLIFRAKNGLKIHNIMQQLLCEYFDKQICSAEIIDSYMVVLFSEILRSYHLNNSKDTNIQNDDVILPMLKYIEEHYKQLTLNDLAEHFKFHPNYLSSLIRKKTGKTFKQLIIAQRLNQALFYIKNTNMPISQIANEVGYNNLGFFYKKFYAYFDLYPNEIRKKIK